MNECTTPPRIQNEARQDKVSRSERKIPSLRARVKVNLAPADALGDGHQLVIGRGGIGDAAKIITIIINAVCAGVVDEDGGGGGRPRWRWRWRWRRRLVAESERRVPHEALVREGRGSFIVHHT